MSSRRILTVCGCVQGVGFRPFVYRLAKRHHLNGSICNTTSGVVIDVQGAEVSLASFQEELVAMKPAGASISEMTIADAPLHNVDTFEIMTSVSHDDTTLPLLPDTAMCQACLQELRDPANRRYQYPFLHCIGCGPRFSLFTSMPFDRSNTTMSSFHMCTLCRQEYDDPDDRRFYSQTNCCPECGPELKLLDKEGSLLSRKNDALAAAATLLDQGKIVAMKNTGGFQLLVDASNDAAVKRLRRLKGREAKPFALLMPSLSSIQHEASVCDAAQAALTSPAAPIVLMRRLKRGSSIASSVAGDSPYFGAMLPHSPIQHLLMDALQRPLVATSGNRSGSPICMDEEEALEQLSSIADAFLVHNRWINHRLDDSIVHIIDGGPVMLRRARGYIPYAVKVPAMPCAAFASGGQQKACFAFIKKYQLYISQHIGDLEEVTTCKAYVDEAEKWERLLSIEPEEAVVDRHPGYFARQYAAHRQLPTTAIQHHEAHLWAGIADNELPLPVTGFAWDGTGYGSDGTIWGGEAFAVTDDAVKRVATLYPFRLPGGEIAVREPRRSAVGLLHALGAADSAMGEELMGKNDLSIVLKALDKGINSPLCSSVGRLFDGVSALLGCCMVSDFEGQAAIAVEAVALEAKAKRRAYRIPLIESKGLLLMDWRPMIEGLLEDKRQNIPAAEIAWSFHDSLAEAIVAVAKVVGNSNVVLSGGVMQNKLLAEMAVEKLRNGGFVPSLHRNIPPNDGGLAFGQAVGSCRHVSCATR